MFAGETEARGFYAELCSPVCGCGSVSNNRRCQGEACGGGADPEHRQMLWKLGPGLPLVLGI